MGKKTVSFADPNFRQQLHEWMQTYNPKPQGEAYKALLKKYEDERTAYIEARRGINLEG